MGLALCPGPRFRPFLKYLSLPLSLSFSLDEWQGLGQRFGYARTPDRATVGEASVD